MTDGQISSHPTTLSCLPAPNTPLSMSQPYKLVHCTFTVLKNQFSNWTTKELLMKEKNIPQVEILVDGDTSQHIWFEAHAPTGLSQFAVGD